VKVTLTRSDREFAGTVAVRRCLSLIIDMPNEDSFDLWGGAIKDATAELVVSRSLGWFWIGDDFLAPQIPREIVLTVGCLAKGETFLPVFKPTPNSVHVAVEELSPLEYDVIGWVSGVVASRREYRVKGGTFNVPREAFHGIETLLASLRSDGTLATE